MCASLVVGSYMRWLLIVGLRLPDRAQPGVIQTVLEAYFFLIRTNLRILPFGVADCVEEAAVDFFIDDDSEVFQ